MRSFRRRLPRSRRGYTLMLVVVFLLVVMSMLGMAFRQMASTLRLEEARTRQIDLEQGSVKLAALGLGMLENVMASPSFEMQQTYDTSAGPKTYTLTMQRQSVDSGTGKEIWSVTVTAP
jgi:Tfp pilus assembly protein PilV